MSSTENHVFFSLMHAFLPPKKTVVFILFQHLGWGLRAQEPSLSRLQLACWRNSRRASKVHKRHPFLMESQENELQLRNKTLFEVVFVNREAAHFHIPLVYFFSFLPLSWLSFFFFYLWPCSFWENCKYERISFIPRWLRGYVPPGTPNNQFISWMFDDFQPFCM